MKGSYGHTIPFIDVGTGEGDYKCKWISNTKGGFIVIFRLS